MKQRLCFRSCDHCGEESPPATTDTEARAVALAEGWQVHNKRDLCPACRPLYRAIPPDRAGAMLPPLL